jgi:HAD superfamily hydrolase (TIGR01509 family)
MTSIHVVLFDAGDILYRRPNRWHRTWEFMAELGLSPLPLDDPSWIDLKTKAHLGIISEDEYFSRLMDLFGIREEQARMRARDIIYREERKIEFIPGVSETLHDLRDMGFRLAVVTDTHISTKEKLQWFQQIGIDGIWDAFATSCERHVCKPDKGLYQAALDPLGFRPDQAVFVGHAKDEMQGARDLGMVTVAFNRDHEDVPADYVIEHFHELPDLLHDIVNLYPASGAA